MEKYTYGLTGTYMKTKYPIFYAIYNKDAMALKAACKKCGNNINDHLEDFGDCELSVAEYAPTPLIAAAEYNFPDGIEILLNYGANINDEGYYWGFYYTPLSVAVENNNITIAKILLERGADHDECGHFNPMIQAICENNFDMVKLLLDYGVNPNKKVYDYGLRFDNENSAEAPSTFAKEPFDDAEDRSKIIELLKTYC